MIKEEMSKTHIWDSMEMKWVVPDYWSIEYDSEYEWYSVFAFGVWGKNSLLEGQTMKVHKDSLYSIEEAKSAYPQATIGYIDPQNSVDHLPDYD